MSKEEVVAKGQTDAENFTKTTTMLPKLGHIDARGSKEDENDGR